MKRRGFMTWMTWAFAAGLIMTGTALGATVNLSWDYDVADEAEIQGYRIYYGGTSQAGVSDPVDLVSAAPYEQRIEIANPSLRGYSINLGPGVYYFRMTAYGLVDGNPEDSVFSGEVLGQVGLVTITNLSLTITYP